MTLPLTSRAASPLGVWKTIDDQTGEAKSLVTIEEHNGKLSGTITQILNPARRDAICDQCKGELKNKKIEGMRILWNMEKEGKKIRQRKYT